MQHKEYDGPIVPHGETHYHNWFLTRATDPDTIAYIPALRAYANRMTAWRHGQQFVDAGQAITVMVLLCDGGAECPIDTHRTVQTENDPTPIAPQPQGRVNHNNHARDNEVILQNES